MIRNIEHYSKLYKGVLDKKNNFINNLMYNLIEFYFRKLNSSFSKIIDIKYSYFIKKTP